MVKKKTEVKASSGENKDLCPSCWESFFLKRPKLLECGHSICIECANKLFDQGEIKCPVCGAVTSVPYADGLPDDEVWLSRAGKTEKVPKAESKPSGGSESLRTRKPRPSQRTSPNPADSKPADSKPGDSKPVKPKPILDRKFSSLQDLMDNPRSGKGGEIAIPYLRDTFNAQGTLEEDYGLILVNGAKSLLMTEPNVLELKGPINLIGDMHGQFYDLMNLFERAGHVEKGARYLFLGDYVDRGVFGCEVILYLFALKFYFPDRIYMLRGNHESKNQTMVYGFQKECEIVKYNSDFYRKIMSAFNCLPLAAIVSTPDFRLFCVHGGISDETMKLRDIMNIERKEEPRDDTPLLDLLWADPKQTWDGRFAFNENRGCSYVYGTAAVKEFLEQNDLTCIVRAHEVQYDGFHWHFKDLNDGLPRYQISEAARRRGIESEVLTIFSAPNYVDEYGNWAAYVTVEDNKPLAFDTFECVEHPVLNVQDTMGWRDILFRKVKFLTTDLPSLVQAALGYKPSLMAGGKKEELDEATKALETIKAAPLPFTTKAMRLAGEFERALMMDAENERKPTVAEEKEVEELASIGKAVRASKVSIEDDFKAISVSVRKAVERWNRPQPKKDDHKKENSRNPKPLRGRKFDVFGERKGPKETPKERPKAPKKEEEMPVGPTPGRACRLPEVAEEKTPARVSTPTLDFDDDEQFVIKIVFKYLDVDEDKKISLKDLIEVAKRQNETNITESQLEAFIQYIDLNGDGTIDFSDFVIFAGFLKTEYKESKGE